jgi:hypothetical protein
MAETVKKTKAAAKPRKTAAKKTGEPASADPVIQNHHGAPENHSNGSHQPSFSQDEVARLAHKFWKESGHRHGQHEEDWYRAEQVLRSKAS